MAKGIRIGLNNKEQAIINNLKTYLGNSNSLAIKKLFAEKLIEVILNNLSCRQVDDIGVTKYRFLDDLANGHIFK